MPDTLDLRGRWWLPEHQGHRVHGTLTWSAEDGGTLYLHDELRPIEWRDNHLPDGSVQRYRHVESGTNASYPLIHGQVGSRAYTLLGAFRVGAQEFSDHDRSETVHVNRCLEGAWFADPDEICVDEVAVEMRHLTSWVHQSGIEVEWPRVQGSRTEVFGRLTAKILPPHEVEHDGLRLRLRQRLGGVGDYLHHIGIDQEWTLLLTRSAPMPLGTFIDAAGDLQSLVSIAVGKTAQFERVVLRHTDVPLMSLAGTPIGDLKADICLYVRWSNRSAVCEPVSAGDLFFDFEDFGGVEGVGRWIRAAAKYRTELGRVMATRYREGSYVEDRIMNVCAALDSFDKTRRGTGKWVDYRSRVASCVDLAGPTFGALVVEDVDSWIERVVDTRDDLAHHRERFRETGTVGDYLLGEQVFWLFVLCMLKVADSPDRVYERIRKHSQFDWMVGQASLDRGAPS